MPPHVDRVISAQVIKPRPPRDQPVVLNNARPVCQAESEPSSDAPTHPLLCIDILDMVFSACVDLDSNYCDLSKVLSQVCHEWRSFVVSSPKHGTAIKLRCHGAEGDHWWTSEGAP